MDLIALCQRCHRKRHNKGITKEERRLRREEREQRERGRKSKAALRRLAVKAEAAEEERERELARLSKRLPSGLTVRDAREAALKAVRKQRGS